MHSGSILAANSSHVADALVCVSLFIYEYIALGDLVVFFHTMFAQMMSNRAPTHAFISPSASGFFLLT